MQQFIKWFMWRFDFFFWKIAGSWTKPQRNLLIKKQREESYTDFWKESLVFQKKSLGEFICIKNLERISRKNQEDILWESWEEHLEINRNWISGITSIRNPWKNSGRHNWKSTWKHFEINRSVWEEISAKIPGSLRRFPQAIPEKNPNECFPKQHLERFPEWFRSLFCLQDVREENLEKCWEEPLQKFWEQFLEESREKSLL